MLIGLYYVLSLLLMNNNPYVLHYYDKYESIEEAKSKGGLINADVPYKLNGFTREQEQAIRNNIFIYTTKSNYEEFYGFLIRIEHEDKEMLRVTIDSKNEIDVLPEFLINKELFVKNISEGFFTYASFDVFRQEKEVILNVIEYQNHKPVRLGSIILDLQ
jgi:hypothetical protein